MEGGKEEGGGNVKRRKGMSLKKDGRKDRREKEIKEGSNSREK